LLAQFWPLFWPLPALPPLWLPRPRWEDALWLLFVLLTLLWLLELLFWPLLGSYVHRMRYPILLATRPFQLHCICHSILEGKFPRQVPHFWVPNSIRQSLLHFAKLMLYQLRLFWSM
jgi:hypothetical protein